MDGKSYELLKSDKVRIVKLESFNYISFCAISKQPEMDALKKLGDWKAKTGFEETVESKSFGFNNPIPEKGNPVYGYEIWLTVGGDEKIEDAEIKTFEGGTYAVATTTAENPEIDIPLMWERLSEFLNESEYEMGNHQWFEEILPPDEKNKEFKLDLYFPIKK